MEYKSSVKQAKFDYSPLGRAFNKGLDKDDQKQGLFKELENIKGRNEELLGEIKNSRTKDSGNKNSKTAKAKNFFIYDQNPKFYKYRFDKFSNISSIESKFHMLEIFYTEFISLKSLEARTKENTNQKFFVLNSALNEYDKMIKQYKKVYEREPKDEKRYGWKQKCSPKNLKTLDHQPVKLEKKSLADENRSDLKQPTQLKQLKLNEIPKPLWIKLSREDFNSLIKYVVNDLDNNKFKTIVDGNKYDLKNAETFLLEIINKKTSEIKAHELCNNLIKSDIAAVKKSTSSSKDKRNNILSILSNLKSVFTGVYLHYDNVSEPKFEKDCRKKQIKKTKI